MNSPASEKKNDKCIWNHDEPTIWPKSWKDIHSN